MILSRRSLRLRLIAIAAVTGVAGVLVAGIVLLSLYEGSLRRSFDDRLDVYLTSLIATAVDADGRLEEPSGLGDPNFVIPQSGWAWQIEADGMPPFLSPSLVGERVPVPEPASGQVIVYSDVVGMGGLDLRLASRSLILPTGTRASFTILADPMEVEASVWDFRIAALVTLSILALSIIFAALAQVRLGLAPLDDLRVDIAEIARGRAKRLEGDYPLEVEPLVSELNGLLNLNTELIERARTHVGNLAHALKTPLSVIVNEAREAGDEKVVEQAHLMRGRIDIALDRARMAARSGTVGAVCDVADALAGIVRVMRKLHHRDGVVFELNVPSGLLFRGETQDFEELTGNLVENAGKWARSRVAVAAKPVPGASPPLLMLTVEDDGPGLRAEDRSAALQRGRRLDETVPGSGLGLSIVVELVKLYGGTIALDDATLGGLQVVVRLPRVED